MHPEELLSVFADSSVYYLKEGFTDFENGTISKLKRIHAYSALYRQRGVCLLLTEGIPDPLFVAQQQSVSAYLYRLPTIPVDDQILSLASIFWDAVGGQYWDAAQNVVDLSTKKWNPKREHKEDFCYIRFIMMKYFVPESKSTLESLLDDWEGALEGTEDSRLDFCAALLLQDDGERIEAALEHFRIVGEDRLEDVERKIEKGTISEDIAVWFRPVWTEGLALIRLLERDGIRVPVDFPQVPECLRVDNPYAFSSDAWREIGYTPKRVQR